MGMANLAERERVAFYGAMIWMAQSDGHLSRKEIEIIYGLLDNEELSKAARDEIGEYFLDHPSFVECIQSLGKAQLPLRHAVVINLIDIAMVDGHVDPGEHNALSDACHLLSITVDQHHVLKRVVADLYMLRRRGVDDDAAVVTMQEAVKSLDAVDIPLVALSLCGAVLALRQAGLERALAALGLQEFPSAAVSAIILLGSATAVTLNTLFDDRTVADEVLNTTRETKNDTLLERHQDALGCIFSELGTLPEGDPRWSGLHEASGILSVQVDKLRQKMRMPTGPGG
jgi:uncharacterized tellurite resistance protein B-like protein